MKKERDTTPPQGDADNQPREFVTVHPDGTKEHRTARGHRGKPLPRGSARWQRLKLGGNRYAMEASPPPPIIKPDKASGIYMYGFILAPSMK